MGAYTPNNIFYKPAIGASGAVEKGKFDDGLDVADGLIEDNKPVNNKLSAFAATTSAELAGVISDETGSGKAVFSDSPVLVSPSLGEASAEKIDLTEGQIKFPAAQNPSADPNTQDDYEKGEWTAELKFAGENTDMVMTRSLGSYVKVGKIVTLTGYFTLSAKGTSTGKATLEGIPFVAGPDDKHISTANLWFAFTNYEGTYQGYIMKNTIQILISNITELGVKSDFTNENFNNNSIIIFSLTYNTG